MERGCDVDRGKVKREKGMEYIQAGIISVRRASRSTGRDVIEQEGSALSLRF